MMSMHVNFDKDFMEKYVCDSVHDLKFLKSFKFKKLLNDEYKPDRFVSFVLGDQILPLVIKNNIASFYGGLMPFNDYNSLSARGPLLNGCIKYLTRNGFLFKLLSIDNDCYSLLNDSHRYFDVPYNQRWVYPDVGNFSPENLLEGMTKKRRYKTRRAIDRLKMHSTIQVEPHDFMSQYASLVLDASIQSFKERSKLNAWAANNKLFHKMIHFFVVNYEPIIKLVLDGEKIVGFYMLLSDPSSDEIFLPYANNFNVSDPDVMGGIYFDILNEASTLAKSRKSSMSLDAGRGSFTYKKRFNFMAKPLYALVNEPTWCVHYNDDLTINETNALYGRSFGALGN